MEKSRSPNLHLEHTGIVLLDIDIDGKVGVNITHLILETLGHTDDQVLDDCLDGSEGSNILARAVVQFDDEAVLRGAREDDGEMLEIFGEFASRAFDGDDAGSDVDFHCSRLEMVRSKS